MADRKAFLVRLDPARRGVAIARLVSAAAPKRIATSQRQGVAAIFAQLRAQRDGVVLKGKLKDIAGAGRD